MSASSSAVRKVLFHYPKRQDSEKEVSRERACWEQLRWCASDAGGEMPIALTQHAQVDERLLETEAMWSHCHLQRERSGGEQCDMKGDSDQFLFVNSSGCTEGDDSVGIRYASLLQMDPAT